MTKNSNSKRTGGSNITFALSEAASGAQRMLTGDLSNNDIALYQSPTLSPSAFLTQRPVGLASVLERTSTTSPWSTALKGEAGDPMRIAWFQQGSSSLSPAVEGFGHEQFLGNRIRMLSGVDILPMVTALAKSLRINPPRIRAKGDDVTVDFDAPGNMVSLLLDAEHCYISAFSKTKEAKISYEVDGAIDTEAMFMLYLLFQRLKTSSPSEPSYD